MAACVWALTRPGMTAIPDPFTTSSPGWAVTSGPMASMSPLTHRSAVGVPSSVTSVIVSGGVVPALSWVAMAGTVYRCHGASSSVVRAGDS